MSDLLHDRYRIVRPLGQGGAGQTYLGHDTRTDTDVVIKELYAAVQPGGDTARVREAEVLRRLDHERIPKLVDAFVEPVRGVRRLHLVMAHVEGRSLAEEVEARRPTVDEVQALLDELLGILEDLQALSPPLLHRDIKPANVLRTTDGRLMLIDFGLATDALDKTFGHTMVAGTLGYQAPEQIAGQPVPASDVYSTGVLAWSLLSGKAPADRLSGQELKRWQADVAHVPAWWTAWLERALAPVGTRFRTAKEARAALGVTEAVPAPRPKPPAAVGADWEPWQFVVLFWAVMVLPGAGYLIWANWMPKAPKEETSAAPVTTCADGAAEACFAAAMAQLDADPPALGTALPLLERGCELGSKSSCFWLGDVYRGESWLPADPVKATRFMAAACQLNATNSCDILVMSVGSLDEATRAAEIDRFVARWEQTCTAANDLLADPWTCNVLVYWHERKKPWTVPSPDSAVPWSERLCNAGYDAGCLHLAGLLAERAPAHLDAPRALVLYTRLCETVETTDFDAERLKKTACQAAERTRRLAE